MVAGEDQSGVLRDRAHEAAGDLRCSRLDDRALSVRQPHPDGARDAGGGRGQGDRLSDGDQRRSDHRDDVRRRRCDGGGRLSALCDAVPRRQPRHGLPARYQGLHGSRPRRDRQHGRGDDRRARTRCLRERGAADDSVRAPLGGSTRSGDRASGPRRPHGRIRHVRKEVRPASAGRRRDSGWDRRSAEGLFQIKDVVAFYALFLVLIFRPAGLLGERLAAEDRA